jgi:hypothetical protein
MFFKVHIPFLITYSPFSGQAECIPPRLERFAAQQGREKEVGLGWLFFKKKKAGLAIFTKKNKIAGLVMW